MRLPRRILGAAAVLFGIAAASAQDRPDPRAMPLFPDYLVSLATDGVDRAGAHARTTVFLTNAGGVALGAELVFVDMSGEHRAHHGVPFIAPGATVPVSVREIVGPEAPEWIAGTVRARFLAPPPLDPAGGLPDGPERAAGFVAATTVRSFEGTEHDGRAPDVEYLEVGRVEPLRRHPPCPPPPCPPPCPPEHPCPTPEHPCRPAPDADCGPPPPPPPPPERPPCPREHPCPTPDHPCRPAPGADCGPHPPRPPDGR